MTVKDYTWGGSQGYLNPKRGGTPERFRTIIQIVPVPPGGAKAAVATDSAGVSPGYSDFR